MNQTGLTNFTLFFVMIGFVFILIAILDSWFTAWMRKRKKRKG